MVNWKETKCGKCKIQRGRPVCNSCFSYDKFIPITITNADRIRAMSDDELADFMYAKDIPWCDDSECPTETLCKDCFSKWLQSEVEE